MNRERLIRLFTMDRPHCLRYRLRSAEHNSDKRDLELMIVDGLVEVIEMDSKFVLFHYIGNK